MGTAVHTGTRRGGTRVDQIPPSGPDAFPGTPPGTEGRAYRSPQHSRSEAEGLAAFLGWFSVGLGAAQLIAPGAVARICGLEPTGSTKSLMRVFGLRELTSGVGILSNEKPAGWVWSRVAGDLLDATLLAKALTSDENDRGRTMFALANVLGVGALDYLAAQKLSDMPDATRGLVIRNEPLTVRKSITIGLSPEEVYRFWRNYENLPRFMTHLESVTDLGDGRSKWRSRAPAGATVEWEAVTTEDRPNELIAWRSVEGSDVDNAGVVRFEKAPGDRGTEVTVDLTYRPPGGRLAAKVAKFFREEPSQQLYDDLRALKQVLELGEVVKSNASVHRGPHPAAPDGKAHRRGS